MTRFAETGDAVYAADKAGYAQPRTAAVEVIRRERLQGPLAEAKALLQSKGAMRGVKTLIRLAKDTEKTPPGVQRAAASDLVKYAGIAATDEALAKELHEMTLEELDKRRQQLMSEAANQAKTIDHEPDSAQRAPNIMD